MYHPTPLNHLIGMVVLYSLLLQGFRSGLHASLKDLLSSRAPQRQAIMCKIQARPCRWVLLRLLLHAQMPVSEACYPVRLPSSRRHQLCLRCPLLQYQRQSLFLWSMLFFRRLLDLSLPLLVSVCCLVSSEASGKQYFKMV